MSDAYPGSLMPRGGEGKWSGSLNGVCADLRKKCGHSQLGLCEKLHSSVSRQWATIERVFAFAHVDEAVRLAVQRFRWLLAQKYVGTISSSCLQQRSVTLTRIMLCCYVVRHSLEMPPCTMIFDHSSTCWYVNAYSMKEPKFLLSCRLCVVVQACELCMVVQSSVFSCSILYEVPLPLSCTSYQLCE